MRLDLVYSEMLHRRETIEALAGRVGESLRELLTASPSASADRDAFGWGAGERERIAVALGRGDAGGA